jgi:hypothetical protein
MFTTRLQSISNVTQVVQLYSNRGQYTTVSQGKKLAGHLPIEPKVAASIRTGDPESPVGVSSGRAKAGINPHTPKGQGLESTDRPLTIVE